MILVRRLIFALFSIALAVQGVAAATMLHSPAMRVVTSASEPSRDLQNPSPVAMAGAADAVAADCEHSHGSHEATERSHTKHADCAGALCCAAFMPLSITSIRFSPAHPAPLVAADYAAVGGDPATFDRPPRT